MIPNLNRIDQIQLVLEIIYNNVDEKSNVSTFSYKELNLDKAIIFQILRKLEKDEYISDFRMIDEEQASAMITFEGGLFYESGSYPEIIKRDKLKTEKLQKENHLRLTVGIGSLIVGFYYLIELLKSASHFLYCQ